MKALVFTISIALLTSSFALRAQQMYTMADTVVAKRCLDEAKKLINAADYDVALQQLDTAEVIYGEIFKETDLRYANVLYQKGRCFYYKGEYSKAEIYNLKALKIRQSIAGTDHPDVAASFNNLGLIYRNQGYFDRALELHQKALDIRQKLYDAEHVDVANSLNNIGVVLRDKGEYDKSVEFDLKALKIRLNILGNEHPDVATTYNNMGVTCWTKGDYIRAEEFYQKSLAIRQKKLGPEHPDVAASFNNLGLVYMQKWDFERAVLFFEKALEVKIKKLGATHLDVARTIGNLGLTYLQSGDYDRAVEFLQKSLEIKSQKLVPNHPAIATSYDHLGLAHLQKGEYDRSVEYFRKALEINIKVFGAQHRDLAVLYHHLGQAFEQKKDYDPAAEYYQKALNVALSTHTASHPDIAQYMVRTGIIFLQKGDLNVSKSFIDRSLNTLRWEGLASLQTTRSIPVLVETLSAKGTLFLSYYLTTKEKSYLYTASASFREALSAINYQRKNLETASSKSTISGKVTGLFEGGVSVNCTLHRLTDSLHYLNDAYYYTEQSKALTLYESMKNIQALHLAEIPDSLLQQENDLRVDIAYYDKRRQALVMERKAETDSIVLNLSGKLFDLRHAYNSLIRTFETHYPEYYRLKYDLQTEDVTSIQRDLLQPDQAMLEYFTGDSSIYIFLIKKDDYRVIEVKKDFPLEAWVQQLRHGIYDYFADSTRSTSLYESAATGYLTAAQRLYEKLLAPVDSLLPKRVIIIPDGVLGYVPFEALLTGQAAERWDHFQDHPYFFRRHDVSYCYSATLLREMTQRRHKKAPKSALLAFAPFEKKSYRQLHDLFGNPVTDTTAIGEELISGSDRHEFDSLPNTGEEVHRIGQLWSGGRYLLNADATETQFASMAGDYRILHLATHGVADHRAGDYSYLAFAQIPDSVENELLYVREIYNISLNADLVTLSACETGIGELQRGEGIISLARAFSYAGAKSIVTSLWAVDDARTKDLMIAFYENLDKGAFKDAALADARRDFLNKNNGLDAHPYFWAGFVAIGDMNAIK